MPELPEVQTTVNGLNAVLKNHTISLVWTDYFVNTTNKRTDTIKNKKYFEKFQKEVVGSKFIKSERRGKNVLIHLSNGQTILIHMKMTGHLLYGTYKRNFKFKILNLKLETEITKNNKIKNDAKYIWQSDDVHLRDPFNQFIHFLIQFDNAKSLAFSDMRKFAKVTLLETKSLKEHADIKILGPEANDLTLDWKTLKARLLKKPKGKIKTVLMDQTIVAGIGNIYSDEILWASGIHPEHKAEDLSDKDVRNILWHARRILSHSITVGGDSMSDYRNIYGERGGYQNSHRAYRQTGKKCQKRGCTGIILRKIIGGRSAHFCSVHQK